MGGNTSKKVSFGLDENEKVTVIEGVKLSDDVLQRMRDAEGSESTKPPPSPPEPGQKQPLSPKPTGPSHTEIHEEIRKNFERQQAQVQEQLASLAQRERERERERDTAAPTELDHLTPALLIEKGKTHEEQEKAKTLAKQLENKEKELASLSNFYKEQLEILDKKNLENYKQTAEQYNEAASKAEADIRPRQIGSVCSGLQSQVLQCYSDHPQQTLLCSSLARQYMSCVQQAKKSSLTNHG
ncbi:coiled-coil-helix-coiled-coil-helix domain containing 6b isoform X2 [Trematomus bernacchii]|uniref:coiled-coil-helix-coiled-coil-helix domain containing 6b isoform X2 n=1 Tax=Trematomus bernacchii TaxID=40690 RepID=UPI00146AEADD|nr:coiled-coil-helix-coiled-coil-helix domain containing 6b isoform X2 [Trematomus bernacchii]